LENAYAAVDGDMATTHVMKHSLITFGLKKLTLKKQAFINFTYSLLMSEMVEYLSPEDIVIELLEDIPLNREVIERCRELKQMGFKIAVDDIVDDYLPDELLPFIDILKIDFLHATNQKKLLLVNKYKHTSLLLLAEKVESQDDFKQAFSLGFDFFQGYYFSKPKIITGVDIQAFPGQYINLLNELNKEESNVDILTGLIELDVSMSYKLLRMVNTIGYSRRVKVSSIKQAILVMGLNELKKWITLLMMTSVIRDEESQELFHLSLTRAKIAEEIAKRQNRKSSEYYLFGLFSAIEAILNKPLLLILEDLPLSSYIKNGLLGREKDLLLLLHLFRDLENGAENPANIELSPAGSTNEELYQIYSHAIEWTNEVLANLS
jgi:EAL and modified HD-GYP domain-containing signal transduction protein